ncbi:MAG: response regulator transcription factor [Bacteroidaceae bacterium]|nr:response regulator transcription factor [Bacteroidaceae bacterium]
MIRCIAIDDEPLALEQIARYIGRIPELQLVGTGMTVAQAQTLMEGSGVDLIFLDIEMPGCSGVEFARYLSDQPHTPFIIFTTAYPQYAIEGFRVDAVDYLLKPLSFDDLSSAVEKVKRRMAASSTPPTDEGDDTQSTLVLKSGTTMRRLSMDDICYIKGLSEYVQICLLSDSKPVTIHESLKHFESILPKDKFLRIHKSYIINLAHIEESNSQQVTVNGRPLPIGQKYRTDFRQYIKSL